jgi:hypothetical protein
MKLLIWFFTLVVILAGAGPAFAILNPEDNVIGPYFDPSADLDCVEGLGMNAQIPVYIILTNPTFNELYGFEMGLDVDGNLIVLGEEFQNAQALNVGSSGNYIVGFGQPTYTEQATILMTLNVLHLGTPESPSHIALHGASPCSVDDNLPAVLLADGEIMPMALHSEYRNFVYVVNGSCSFENEEVSWDGVKSLYRE